jgi:predicted enzyme related to lactoylglutathione lyase
VARLRAIVYVRRDEEDAVTPGTFCRYELRTTDVDAARAFYSDVLDLDFAEPTAIAPLPQQARARGAPAHWLGHLGVDDIEGAIAHFVARGAQPLVPGLPILRDPSGAVLALRAGRAHADAPARKPVTWHQHHTTDLERAWRAYADRFAWTEEGTVAEEGLEGGHRLFAWDSSRACVGRMANTARHPEVHAQWLFYFAVAQLGAAMDKVRARGGLVAGAPRALRDGTELVACEDAQGAAFGLHAR